MDSARAADGQRRVAADQWDIDGWHILSSEAEKAPFDAAESVYETLVKQFPPIGKFWRSYAEHLTREQPNNHEAIVSLYDRAVKNAPTSIELWRSYLAYVSARAAEIPGSKHESDAIVVHERAVKYAGLDLSAHPLWTHYIEFVKKQTMLSDSQRRDALRRVYQRAVMNFNPLFCVSSERSYLPVLCLHAEASARPCLLPPSSKKNISSTSSYCSLHALRTYLCCFIILVSLFHSRHYDEASPCFLFFNHA